MPACGQNAFLWLFFGGGLQPAMLSSEEDGKIKNNSKEGGFVD